MPEVSASLIVSVGAANQPDAHVISRAYSAFVRGDRLFVANGGVPEIRVYDMRGHLLRTIGRRGSGPGEFRNLRYIAPRGSDSLVALDMLARRVTVFDRQGQYARSYQLQMPQYGQPEAVADYNGRLLVAYSHGVEARINLRFARDTFSLAYVARDTADGSALVAIAPPVLGRWWEIISPGRARMVEAGPRVSFDVSEDVVMLTSGEDHSVLRLQGGVWERVPLAGHAGGNGAVGAGDIVVRLYDQLIVESRDYFWLGDFVAAEGPLRRWRRFRRDGVLEETMRLPANARILQVTGNRIVVRVTDADGVEYIQVMRLEQSPDPKS